MCEPGCLLPSEAGLTHPHDEDLQRVRSPPDEIQGTSATPSTAASTSDTILTADEDAHQCEEWELFSDLDNFSQNRPSSEITARTWTPSEQRVAPCDQQSDTNACLTAQFESATDVCFDSLETTRLGEHLSTNETGLTGQVEAEEATSARTPHDCEENLTECLSSDQFEVEIPPEPVLSSVVTPDTCSTVNIEVSGVAPSVSSGASLQVVERTIQVYIRVRPPSQTEGKVDGVTLGESPHTLHVHSNATQGGCSVMECSFDRVFMETTAQDAVFDAVVPNVEATLAGYNATIFAYGQTGTGKTHTIFGEDLGPLAIIPDSGCRNADEGGGENVLNVVGTSETGECKELSDTNGMGSVHLRVRTLWGVIPRAMAYLLSQAASLTESDAYSTIELCCSFMQIYNDRLFDLLVDRKRQKPLLIREQPAIDGTTNVVIQGLSSEPITSLSGALQLIQRGRTNRSVRETELNASSSRSHAIVQINVTTERKLENGDKRVYKSRLNLVDLAGSEKWNTDLEMEDRHSQELKNINTSLSALGNCIAALTEAGRKHIPYRDSTLTRVLQDSFGGNTQACLIATLSPSQKASEENMRTIQFADRARSVLQLIRVNESFSGNAELVHAKAQIMTLRKRLKSEQERRHATRLKEYEAMQRGFAEKLLVKDKQIQKLQRDNEVYTKWREEDTKKIRALEGKVKDLEMALREQQRQSVGRIEVVATKHVIDDCREETTVLEDQIIEVHSTSSNDGPAQNQTQHQLARQQKQPSDQQQQQQQLESRRGSKVGSRETGHQNQSQRNVADISSRSDKPNDTKAYRSLLERYALKSRKGRNVDVPSQHRRISKDHRSNISCDGNDSRNPAVECENAKECLPLGAQTDVLPDQSHSLTQPAEKSSIQSTPTWNSGPTADFDTRCGGGRGHGNQEPRLVYSQSVSLSSEFGRRASPQPGESSTNPSTWVSNANHLPFTKQLTLPGSQSSEITSSACAPSVPPSIGATMHTASPGAIPIAGSQGNPSWRLPSVLQSSASDPSLNSWNSHPSGVPTTSILSVCIKHQLKGCILCTAKEKPTPLRSLSSSTMPTPTKPAAAIEEDGAQRDRVDVHAQISTTTRQPSCERHQLAGCFLCAKSHVSASIGSGMTKPTTHTPAVEYTTNPQSINGYLGNTEVNRAAWREGRCRGDMNRCATHMLHNCILCANSRGMVTNISSMQVNSNSTATAWSNSNLGSAGNMNTPASFPRFQPQTTTQPTTTEHTGSYYTRNDNASSFHTRIDHQSSSTGDFSSLTHHVASAYQGYQPFQHTQDKSIPNLIPRSIKELAMDSTSQYQ